MRFPQLIMQSYLDLLRLLKLYSAISRAAAFNWLNLYFRVVYEHVPGAQPDICGERGFFGKNSPFGSNFTPFYNHLTKLNFQDLEA